MTQRLSHLNARGEAHMVDVGAKAVTQREAVASGYIQMAASTLELLSEGELPKGDVLATARIAGIQAAKKTADLIPLCHTLPLSSVKVDFELDPSLPGVLIKATCRVEGRTGVEMEALTAVSVAGLTLYDMSKAVDKLMVIGAIQVESKAGGASGDWVRHAGVEPSEVEPSHESNSTEQLTILFFAALRESLECERLTLPIKEHISTVADIKQHLVSVDSRYARLTTDKVLVAINRKMARDDSPVRAGDEVGFFPPVTGG